MFNFFQWTKNKQNSPTTPEEAPKIEATGDVFRDVPLDNQADDALKPVILYMDKNDSEVPMYEEFKGSHAIKLPDQFQKGEQQEDIGSDNAKIVQDIEDINVMDATLKIAQENSLEQSQDLALKRSHKRTNDGNETQKKKKKAHSQDFDHAMNNAMVLKINDETCNNDPLSNHEYLTIAGFPTAELDKKVVPFFKTLYSRTKRSIINLHPIHRQPYHHHWVRVQTVTPEMQQFFPTALKILESGVTKNFTFIGETNIQQALLSLMDERKGHIYIEGEQVNVKDAIRQLLNISKQYFTTMEWNKHGVDVDKIVIHGLFTDGKTLNFQRPHTDYNYVTKLLDPTAKIGTGDIAGEIKVVRKNKKGSSDNTSATQKTKAGVPTKTGSSLISMSRQMYAWTAHMPITQDGMWINLWFGPGYGHAIYVNYGETLFLRSDMVHGGGVPMSVEAKGVKKYYRLHFYLPTDLQPAYPGRNNHVHYDNETQIADIYLLPETSFDKKNK